MKIINGVWSPLDEILHDTTHLINHVHSRQRWIGEHGARNLEIDCGATGTMAVFQNTAGNDTWSAAPLCLIGTGDGPFVTGSTHYHPNMLLIHDVAVAADTDLHYLRIVYGTGTVAEAITAEQFSEVHFIPLRAGGHERMEFNMPGLVYGTDKVWVTHWVDGENAPTMDFRFGLHEH